MIKKNNKVPLGLYLIIDAGLEKEYLFKKIKEALEGGVSLLQVYNTIPETPARVKNLETICRLCHQHGVPVIVNNEWPQLKRFSFDGVHFDKIPANYEQVNKKINDSYIKGITCSNDLSVIKWANNHQFDYVSFCSMFPTKSAATCEIVSVEKVKMARNMTQMPIFLAGGINENNLQQLTGITYDGVAVISGIMDSEDISLSTRKYITHLKNMKNET